MKFLKCILILNTYITPSFFFFFLIQKAAAYGFPIVATRNGGPVDIHRVFLLNFHIIYE